MLSCPKELPRSDLFAIITHLRSLFKNSKRLSSSFNCLGSVSFLNLRIHSILSCKWGVRSIVIPSNAENATLRLWFTRNWRENRGHFLSLSIMSFLMSVCILWFSFDLVSIIVKGRCYHNTWVAAATKKISECLMNIVVGEGLSLCGI